MREKVEDVVKKITYFLEILLGVLIGVGVIIGIGNLFKFYPVIIDANLGQSYQLFNDYLAYAFILIVGIELILMILNHSTTSILNLMLFVIARKMLIYSETMLDLVFGSMAVAIILATTKYLTGHYKGDIVKRGRETGLYSAAAKVGNIVDETGCNIPTNEVQTIGGLVSHLAEASNTPIVQGAKYRTGDIIIEVISATDDGVIGEVQITKSSEMTIEAEEKEK